MKKLIGVALLVVTSAVGFGTDRMPQASAAAPKCEFKGKPKYPIRGFMLDVGRMHHSMDTLRQIVLEMRKYGLNIFHVHLNDNGFPKHFGGDWNKTQAAFRLECDTYPGLTAKDGHYTKKEFRNFVKWAKKLGVEVVPEIDVPAHSLAFTRYHPEFASRKYGPDHLDLDKSKEILEFLDKLFAEYLSGPNPVFSGKFVHVGTDEYDKRDVEKFRAFIDAMFAMVQKYGKTPWAWGSLTHAKGKTPVRAGKGILMDLFSKDYYTHHDALRDGYSIVNCWDQPLYIVPKAGYYNDYLNIDWIEKNWTPNNIRGEIVDSKLLVGAKFCLWNDLCGKGYTEKDNLDRIFKVLPVFGRKLWYGK